MKPRKLVLTICFTMVLLGAARVLIYPKRPGLPGAETVQTPQRTSTPPRLEASNTPAPKITATDVAVESPPVPTASLPDPDGQICVFWYARTSDAAAEGMQKIIADFNATNEWGITVVGVDQGGQSNLQDAVNDAITTGDLPNIAPGFPNAIASWYDAGFVVDLNQYIHDPVFGLPAAVLGATHPANLASGSTSDGVQFGMPIHQSANVLFYNQTWAQELGFDRAPATADEFKEQACAAAAANHGDDIPDNGATGGLVTRSFGASDVAAWLFAFGGSFLNESGDSYNLNTDEMKAVAAFLRDLQDSACWQRIDGFPNREFAARQALFVMSSTAGLPFQASAFTQAGNPDEWGLIAFPGPDGNLAINTYAQLIGITDISPEANLAAWLWLRHFTSPEIQAEWITYSAYFPSQTATSDFLGSYVADHPIYATGLDLGQYGQSEPNLASWGAVRGAISEAFSAIFDAADSAEVEEILMNLDLTAAELLAESQ